jgi:hypothetical protein
VNLSGAKEFLLTPCQTPYILYTKHGTIGTPDWTSANQLGSHHLVSSSPDIFGPNQTIRSANGTSTRQGKKRKSYEISRSGPNQQSSSSLLRKENTRKSPDSTDEFIDIDTLEIPDKLPLLYSTRPATLQPIQYNPPKKPRIITESATLVADNKNWNLTNLTRFESLLEKKFQDIEAEIDQLLNAGIIIPKDLTSRRKAIREQKKSVAALYTLCEKFAMLEQQKSELKNSVYKVYNTDNDKLANERQITLRAVIKQILIIESKIGQVIRIYNIAADFDIDFNAQTIQQSPDTTNSKTFQESALGIRYLGPGNFHQIQLSTKISTSGLTPDKTSITDTLQLLYKRRYQRGAKTAYILGKKLPSQVYIPLASLENNIQYIPASIIDKFLELTGDNNQPSPNLQVMIPTRGISGPRSLSLPVYPGYIYLIKYPWSENVKRVLKDNFRLQGFRSNQLEAINTTLGRKDIFVLIPTGSRKSLYYQLPVLVQSGTTQGISVVVSPLISLIQDQVQYLSNLGIPAFYINSKLDQKEKNKIIQFFREHEPERHVKLLYITPEMVKKSSTLIAALTDLNKQQKLVYFVIDKAYCISQ